MDELSKFLHAPQELIEQEGEVFAACDVVFTGGPSLYKAKRDRHPNVHCFATDWRTALTSIQTIAELRCEMIVPGHGKPMSGDGYRSDLRHLLENWTDEGLPEHGKYVPEH